MRRIFTAYFQSLLKHGRLTIETSYGALTFGDGSGADLALRVNDRRAIIRLLINPALAFGELYMDGRIEVVRGTLFEVLAMASRSFLESGTLDWARTLDRLRSTIGRLNPADNPARSRANVAHHYDLDVRLYRLFLDRDLQYSCAYFKDGDETLGDAQRAKLRHIVAKLLIEPGHRVLDIGCGWGGMGIYIAQQTGARVRGITLSREQCAIARERARDARLEGRADFMIEDYREATGPFDRIVSVGMLEHVGRKGYTAFFQHLADLLDDDGVALVHTIGRTLGPAPTNEWALKYIFPGGYIPSLSELTPAIEAAGLFVTDIETLRLHYAETIRAWRENFASHRDAAMALYDERFCRMWDLYLCGAENAFRIEKQVVFQIQLAKKVDTVPLTRAYMAEREDALESLDRHQVRLDLRHRGGER